MDSKTIFSCGCSSDISCGGLCVWKENGEINTCGHLIINTMFKEE